jgi:hypothetical protein
MVMTGWPYIAGHTHQNSEMIHILMLWLQLEGAQSAEDQEDQRMPLSSYV